MRWVYAAGIVTVAAVVAAGSAGAFPGAAPKAVEPTAVTTARGTLEMLKALRVQPERPQGYSRDKFAHWSDLDADGCDTRREVLIDEAKKVPSVGKDCWLSNGSWISLYDGQQRSGYPADFDVDHLVPLAEAWRSGASRWNEDKRELFANDLENRETLIAVTASTNRSKSDKGPEAWLPPKAVARCGYAADWVKVKYYWGLSVDKREKKALARILARCPSNSTLVR